jgi:hypothetical protein
MPYKDPQRKKQWESDNRERRNAQRREQRKETAKNEFPPTRAHDPTAEQGKSAWKFIAGVLAVLGLPILLALIGGQSSVPDLRK